MKEIAKILKRYGTIIADKEHETTKGHLIRFITYKYEGSNYVVTMFDGEVIMTSLKED
jgi:hypothetical protein